MNPLLARLGIDPVRYRILTALFHTLSRRQETLNQHLGFNQGGLWMMAAFNFFIGAAMAALNGLMQDNVGSYLAAFLFFTAFLLMAVLIAETANTLVNPEEALVLVHQPIDGATYTAAKLTHLARIVLYAAGSLNAVPCLAGLVVPGAAVWYPAWHMAAVLTAGFAVALGCCALFGWLMRFLPPARMKAGAQVLSGLAFFLFMPQFPLLKVLTATELPTSRTTRIAIAAFALAAVAGGLRSLSVDYLMRAAALIQGGSSRRGPERRWRLFTIPRHLADRWAGGPAAGAGFAYVTKLAARDWQFRRQLVSLLPLLIMMMTFGSAGTPFGRVFSAAHGFPHLLGVMALSLCPNIKGGSNHQAVWLFQLAPPGALGPFARGAGLSLWTLLSVSPHLILLPLMVWRWGAADGLLFAGFSLAFSSAYVSVSLALVDGLPFGHPPKESASPWLMAAMLGAMILGGACAAGQHFVLFRSRPAVAVASVLLAGFAAWCGGRNAGSMAAAIQAYLASLAAPRRGTVLYIEID